MNFLAGFLMKSGYTEEQSFWLLTTMIESIMPIDYYSDMVDFAFNIPGNCDCRLINAGGIYEIIFTKFIHDFYRLGAGYFIFRGLMVHLHLRSDFRKHKRKLFNLNTR